MTQIVNALNDLTDEVMSHKAERATLNKLGHVKAETTADTLIVPNATENNAGAHNAIYRGKHLGDSYTPEQQAMVEAGTFDDLFIGDYWEIDGSRGALPHLIIF